MDNATPPEENKETELEACTREKEEYLNGWKRAKADLINYKKEELTRAGELIRFSNEELLRELIQVLDSFDLAFRTNDEAGAPEKGLLLIRSQFEGMLKRNGLEEIKAAGEPFNPALHEAIEEVESEKPAGVVVEEIARGWKLHEKVIRPSRVKISKSKT